MRLIQNGYKTAFPVKSYHKRGKTLIKKFATLYNNPKILSPEGIFIGNSQATSMVARDFAAYLVGSCRPSVLPTILAGALANSLATGNSRNATFAQAKAMVKLGFDRHIKTQVFAMAKHDLDSFCKKLSDLIFGTASARKPETSLNLNEVYMYLILNLLKTGFKRIAELLPATENPKRKEDSFIFSKDIIDLPNNNRIFLLMRPTKQRRQKGSNESEAVPFLKHFEPSEIIVSPGQTIAIIKSLAVIRDIDLSEPLTLTSPRNHRKGRLTQSKFRKWLKSKAKELGFSTSFCKLASPRFIRKTAMSNALAASDNPAIAAKLVRHADPSTTYKHYHHPDMVTLAQWQSIASSGSQISQPAEKNHRGYSS